MINRDLLVILCCPECKGDLTEADEALSCNTCARDYPIVDGIPVFVRHEELCENKTTLSEFYESFGWHKGENSDIFQSQATFGNSNLCMRDYRFRSNCRIASVFDPSGTYFVDCASGAVAVDEYLEYSRGYRYHVCVDLTMSALRAAREKLGDKGLYINADATCLPIKNDAVEQVFSSHTLFHVPKQQQANVVKEFHRIVKPGHQCLIIYNLGRHSLIGRLIAPYFWLRREARIKGAPKLYSYHFKLGWFRQFEGLFSSHRNLVYRFLPNQVIRYLFPNHPVTRFLGSRLIDLMAIIERVHALAPLSQFFLVVFRK